MLISEEQEEAMFERVFLENAVHDLPDKLKVVVAMNAAGYTQKECASVIGLTKAAVGSIFKKSLVRIREHMEKENQDNL